MKTEPAITVASITAAVTAILALLVAYGFDVSDEQQQAILGIVAVAAPIIVGIVTRQNVWAPASVETVKQDAYRAGLDDAQPNTQGVSGGDHSYVSPAATFVSPETTRPQAGIRRQTNPGAR